MNFLLFVAIIVGLLSFFLIGMWISTRVERFQHRGRKWDQAIFTIALVLTMFSWCIPGGVLLAGCVMFLGSAIMGFAFPRP